MTSAIQVASGAGDQLTTLFNALQLRSGDHVAMLCSNGAAFAEARSVLTATGLVAVPINPKLTSEEVRYILEHSRARLVIATHSLEETARSAVQNISAARAPHLHVLSEVDQELFSLSGRPRGGPRTMKGADIGASVIYTSGTTGHPKGCFRSADQEAARANELIATYSVTGNDVHLIACPLAHSAPGILLRAIHAVGATTHIMPHFAAEPFLAALAKTNASIFFLVPTQYERILSLPERVRRSYSTSSVRCALVAGAPIRSETKQKIVDWLGDGRLWEFYGSSETGTVAVLPPGEQLKKPGAVGKPPPGTHVKILDAERKQVAVGQVGEIFVRSPAVMSGYLPNQAEQEVIADSHNGFITVGDLGRQDADGYLYLVGRKHDTIISGGVNVYPAEVERAICTHDEVVGAVVFGVADPEWGQIVAAAVATRAQDSLPGPSLRSYLRDHLAAYKLPKAIAFIEPSELPLGGSGKPLRRKAAQMLVGSERLRRYDHVR